MCRWRYGVQGPLSQYREGLRILLKHGRRMTPPSSLPRRDLILIPLIGLVTVLVMLLAAEGVSRFLFAESGAETCSLPGGSFTGMKPNCVSHRKAAEGPDVESAYNDCGYRSPDPCRPRPVDKIRVALMGTSSAQGFKVPYRDSFAARAAAWLDVHCTQQVEFQNMGIAGASLLDVYRRIDEALAMRPDLIVLVFGPYDLKARLDRTQFAARDEPPKPMPAGPASVPNKSLVARLSDLAAYSRALVVAQHFLFADRGTFVRLWLLHGEDADFLREPLRPGWEARLADVDALLGSMADRARAQGVPMMLALAPMRIQAALVSGDTPNADPFAIGERLRAIADRHGVLFVDPLRRFAAEKSPERMFYPVDGHMDSAGSAVFADALTQRLIQKDVTPFAACRGDG